MFKHLSRMARQLGQGARMLVGMADYDTYVAHMHSKHPDQPVMSRKAFFCERQNARYNGASGRPTRCC